MNKYSAVVVNLHSPREKVWGILLGIETAGVTLHGIDLNSFEDWTREVARGQSSMSLSTVFFPMHRVERILLDEGTGEIQSMAAVFASRVGEDLWSHLGFPLPSDEEDEGL
jgi:hypothetical protein